MSLNWISCVMSQVISHQALYHPHHARHTIMSQYSQSDLRNAALRILTQREHSAKELEQKLIHKGFAAEDISALISELQQQDWLDEARFADAFVRSRMQHGYGPLRIRQELRQRGVGESVQALALESYADEWQDCVCRARVKRFGDDLPNNLKDRAKQTKFLTYRGFTSEQIRLALDTQASHH